MSDWAAARDEIRAAILERGWNERAAWFRDSEGNLLGLGQANPPPQAED